MSDEKFVCFSISNEENAMTPEDIENAQFTKVHFRIYSADRVNDHNYTCSLKVLKKYAFGKLIEVINPIEHRAEPECKYFSKSLNSKLH